MEGIDVNSTLVRLCQVKIAQNIKALERNISGLPARLLKDLLTILNIDQLDKIEAAALANGISTTPVWKALWEIVADPEHYTLLGVCSGDLNYKQMCMERIFYLVLFGKSQSEHENMWYFYKLDRISILTLTAHYVRTFTDFSVDEMAMTPELLCQISGILEDGVTEIRLSKRELGFQNTMFFKLVLPRLIHYGRVRKVMLSVRGRQRHLSPLLGLIMWRCQDKEPSDKRSDLSQRVEDSCERFHALFPSRSSCGRGQIHTLDIVVPKADFTIVTEALPTCVYLESLRLTFEWTPSSKHISQLLNSLRSLFQKADCSLTSLSLTLLCSNKIVLHVLNACPTLRILTMDITSEHRVYSASDSEEGEDSDSEEDPDSKENVDSGLEENSDSKEEEEKKEECSPAATEIITTDLCLEIFRVKCSNYTDFPIELIVNKSPELRRLDFTGSFSCSAKPFQTLASREATRPMKYRISDGVYDFSFFFVFLMLVICILVIVFQKVQEFNQGRH